MLLEKMVSNEMLLEQRNYYELKDHVLKSAEICIENANKENKKKTMIYCSYVDKQYLEYFTIGYILDYIDKSMVGTTALSASKKQGDGGINRVKIEYSNL